MDTDEKTVPRSILLEGELTEKILAAAFKVLNTLGPEILEHVPEDALC
jgi:hypothetical protein